MRRLAGMGLINPDGRKSPIADPRQWLEFWDDLGPCQASLYARVSPSSKAHRKSLSSQLGYLSKKLPKSIKIKRTGQEIADGRSRRLHEPYVRDELLGLIHWAKSEIIKGKPTVIVAESPSRFIRNSLYSAETPRLPTEQDFRMLHEIADGVPLVVYSYADSIAKIRGQEQSGNRGGKPLATKKRQRAKLQPIARKLRAEGWTLMNIAKHLGKSFSTVRNWTLEGQ
jgi:hypothetical protein